MIARLSCVIIGLGIITLRREGISLKTRLGSYLENLISLLMSVIPMRGENWKEKIDREFFEII